MSLEVSMALISLALSAHYYNVMYLPSVAVVLYNDVQIDIALEF